MNESELINRIKNLENVCERLLFCMEYLQFHCDEPSISDNRTLSFMLDDIRNDIRKRAK